MQPYGHSPWQPSPYGAPPPQYPPPRPPSKPPSRTPWLAIIAIVLVVVFAAGGMSVLAMVLIHRSHAAAVATATGTSTSSSGWSDAASPIPVTPQDPIWGDRDAPVTMVVFGDFQDPFCARLAPTIDSLKSLYGPTDLRVVWKNHPLAFHVNARGAAIAAEGVRALKGNDAFFHFQERAFANQTSLSAARYEDWAVESGVSLRDFQDGLRAHTWEPKIDDDARLASTLAIIVSPVTYVNGIQVTGVALVSSWQRTIDDELPKARAAVASGVAADRVYVTRSTDNFAASAVGAPSATTTYAPPTSPLTVYRVPVGTSPSLGKKDAFVTIVEFADFQCPFCNRAEATLATLRVRYGDDLRIVWKNEPLAFHPRALPAAELAIEARAERGDAIFWKVHDAIYAAQSTGLDEATLLGIARAYGVSESIAKSAMTTAKYQPLIDADHVLAKRVGVSGTPCFFVNGRLLTGAQPVTTFTALIDDEMIKAKDRVAKGTARAKVYDEIIATGVENP